MTHAPLARSRRLAALGTGFALVLVAGSAAAQEWPPDDAWRPALSAGVPITDPCDDQAGAKDLRDIVGTAEAPAVLFHADDAYLSFRIRIADEPGTADDLRPFLWGVEIDTDGDLAKYEYLVQANGVANPDHVLAARNTVQSNTPGSLADVAEEPLGTWPFATHGRVVPAGTSICGGTDFLIDFRVPMDVMAAAGLPLALPVRLVAGGSANPNQMNGDIGNHDGASGTPSLADAATDPGCLGATCSPDADGDGDPDDTDCAPLDPDIHHGAEDRTCDRVDYDCDGRTDDDTPRTATDCGTGACGRSGEWLCVLGEMVDTCVPGEPADEIANGIDDDCDGRVDEDLAEPDVVEPVEDAVEPLPDVPAELPGPEPVPDVPEPVDPGAPDPGPEPVPDVPPPSDPGPTTWTAGGGACTAGGGTPGGGAGIAWLAALTLGLLSPPGRRALRRLRAGRGRQSRLAVLGAALAIAGSTALPATAGADPAIDLLGFQPSPFGGDLFAVQKAATRPQGSWNAGVVLDLQRDPLVLRRTGGPGPDEHAVVSWLLAAHVLGSVALLDGLEVGAVLPVIAFLDGDGMPGGARPDRFGVGDLRLHARLLLFRTPGGMFALSLVPVLSFPTGRRVDPRMGAASATFTPWACMDLAFGRFGFAANLGYRVRARTALLDVDLGDRFEYRVGAWVGLWRGRLDAIAELSGAVSVTARADRENQHPLEVLAGLRQVLVPGLSLHAAAGAGLTRGLGNPDWRVTLGIGYAGAPIPKPATAPSAP
ncbi:MAG TPA: MopE-related protein [Myxococcota bacterium]|nr:MopE-related protein [Myxococcota bacterium]